MYRAAEDESYVAALVGGVLRLSFNRPQFGNSLPKTAVEGLTALFERAQADSEVRCILIGGKGPVFSAGADVSSLMESIAQDAATRQADFSIRLCRARSLVEAIMGFDRPIVVAVRGAAAGAGLFYPLAADYVLGDHTAMFAFAHQRVGLSPDSGVTAVLPQVVGIRMARMLLLTAARVDAQEALRLGIVHRIVSAETLDEEAGALAAKLARAPHEAVTRAKTMVNSASSRSLREILDAETAGIVACVQHDDFVEGVTAFLERRPAAFGK